MPNHPPNQAAIAPSTRASVQISAPCDMVSASTVMFVLLAISPVLPAAGALAAGVLAEGVLVTETAGLLAFAGMLFLMEILPPTPVTFKVPPTSALAPAMTSSVIRRIDAAQEVSPCQAQV